MFTEFSWGSRSKVIRTIIFAICVGLAAMSSANCAWAQTNVITYHYDNARTGHVNETLLTLSNVNKGTFGFRFSQPVDGFITGQALYLSNVNIPNAGQHNVVYVATLHDSVYAFDADNNSGSNAAPLWHVNFTNPAAGITTASGTTLPCHGVTGYPESGIVSTPVIDAASGTMYVVAKTLENGTVFHRLHALDVTNGSEKLSAPVAIAGSVTTQAGSVVRFNSLHAMNRPALLLDNGILYIAFGSNGCNDSSYGWVLAYDATTLTQVGIYNTSPKKGLASIWQTGAGPAADANGYVYVSTAEGDFNGSLGGEDFGSSILKLFESNGTLTQSDYFTPYNQATISQNDLDLSACGVVVLPDQAGSSPHELVASGKQGTVYLLDRDQMGHYNPTNDFQIPQELTQTVGAMFSTPAYWNNRVYFAGNAHPVMAYTLNNGQLQTPPVQSLTLPGSHSPTISANNTTNGILWVMTGRIIYALNALTLQTLYNSGQAGTRDVPPPEPHFSTQMVANGRFYLGTQTNLMVYGLLPALSRVSGNNQSTTVNTMLPLPLQVHLLDSYTKQPVSGVTVTFSDGGKGGTFGSPTAVTDSQGSVSTTYTFNSVARTVTITASNANVASTTFTETSTPAAPEWLLLYSGGGQTAPVTTNLPAPVVTKASDHYGNGISGMVVSFSDGGAGGKFSANPVTTDSTGKASTVYTSSTKSGAITITASTTGLPARKIAETITAGPPTTITAIAGNNQTGAPNTALAQPLAIQLKDQYGNPASGVSVSYSDGGAGGSFSASPVITDSTGQASSSYTTPSQVGTVNIVVSAGALSTQFTVTVH